MKQFKSKKKQAGLTAIELGIVLLVATIVIAVAAANAGKLFGDSQSNTELTNIMQMVTQTKNLKSVAGYGTNGFDLLPQLAATDAIPKNMSYAAGTLTNGWGGEVTLTSTVSGYRLTYNNVPKANCVELAVKISKGGALMTKPGTGTEVTGPIDGAAATAGCAGTFNTLVFTSIN